MAPESPKAGETPCAKPGWQSIRTYIVRLHLVRGSLGRARSVERSSHAASGESLPRSPVSPIARVLIPRRCSSGPWRSNLRARRRVVGLSPHAGAAWFSSTPLRVRARPLLSRPTPTREDRGRQERPLSSPRFVGLWRLGRQDLDAGSGCARGAKPGCRFLARSVDLRRGLSDLRPSLPLLTRTCLVWNWVLTRNSCIRGYFKNRFFPRSFF